MRKLLQPSLVSFKSLVQLAEWHYNVRLQRIKERMAKRCHFVFFILMDFNGLLSSLSHAAAVTLVKRKTRPLNVNCYIFAERFVRKGLVALSKVLIQLPSL